MIYELSLFALSKSNKFRLRYFLELSYKGTHYHGWQNQPDAISVQEVIEKALSTLLRKTIAIVGAGRTDAGVHAKQMYAHFDVEEVLNTDDLVLRLNSFLPNDIAIYNILEVTNEGHARFDATARTYEYLLTKQKNPFYFEGAHVVYKSLDFELMNKATLELFNHTDFKCFSRSKTDVKTYNCKIMHAAWTQKEDFWVFTITADRFLRNMVRAIVGTLIDVGLHKTTIEDFNTIILSKDRNKAGASAPGKALYLTKIEYPKETFITNG